LRKFEGCHHQRKIFSRPY